MKRLFASIHDVSPRFEGQVDRLLDHLAPHVGRRLAMLVVPDHWSSAPITPAFARRLRGCWELNELNTALVEEKSGRELRLGEEIEVVVERVETALGRVDLAPAGSYS